MNSCSPQAKDEGFIYNKNTLRLILGVVVSITILLIAWLYVNKKILLWLDAKPWRYWVPSLTLFAALLTSVWQVQVKRLRVLNWLHFNTAFAFLLLLGLLSFRWPTITYNQQLSDPDESQMLSGAITLFHDPAPFRSVDGTTHGAFNHVPYVIPALLGLPIDYTTGRFVQLLINWLSLIFVWLGLRTFLTEHLSRLAILPAWLLYALALHDAVIHEGTEDVAVAILAASLYTGLVGLNRLRTKQNPRNALFMTGILIGIVPFTKLQGMPPAVWMASVLFYLVVISDADASTKIRNMAALFFGTLLVPLATGVFLYSTDILQDFFQSYVLNNMIYAQQKHYTSWWVFTHFFETAKHVPGYTEYFLPLAIISSGAALSLPLARKQIRTEHMMVAGYGVLSIYAMVAPGRTYLHYPRICIIAASALACTLVAIHVTHLAQRGTKVHGTILALLFAAGTLLPQLYWRWDYKASFCGCYRDAHRLKVDDISALIIKESRPGDQLAQWGWEPKYFIRTQLPQGTHDGHTQRQIEGGEQQEYYRQRFMKDMLKNKPRFFIDSVGGDNFAYKQRDLHAHETFPALKDHVATHYNLMADADGTRLYLLK